MFEIPALHSLTIEDILTIPESQYFDRKSAEIKAKKLAETLIAFANADGGIIAIGVKNGQIEGVKSQGEQKINDFLQAKMDHCKPAIKTEERFLDVINSKGQQDEILLIQVFASRDTVHKTMSDKVFLRVGDENKELTHEQRLDLEYDKGERLFEEQPVKRCRIEDLDDEVLKLYATALKYEGEDLLQPLYARGFIDIASGQPEITAAGVLLFAKMPTKFFPNARIRFIRYDGIYENVGVEMNIIKHEYIEGPLPILIQKAKDVIGAQLRQFTSLDPLTGKFKTVPEYPEFAWQEGIVNAVVHRAYNIQGDDIKVKMFDDRLEIISPGRFPNIVNRDNIREVRYSRNPSIARVLTELGWVRELGEGVKRMYKEMKEYFLEEPEYIEEANSIRLILKNNIVMRRVRNNEQIKKILTDEWTSFEIHEKKAIEMIYHKGKLTTREFANAIGRSTNYAKKILTNLCEKEIFELIRTSIHDPNQYYILKVDPNKSKNEN
ncbi:ATP-binding protein [Ureibacillus suwonensis]|uniref:ATP-binding protein n=1 Tax=Ureibacillus suwonensis TaxID=313007 RepID=A0ABW0RBB2_9BACL